MLILDNVGVFGRPEKNLSVVIDHGIVVWIGDKDSVDVEVDVLQRIDGKGGWLAPGFVDNHVHMSATGMAAASSELFNAGSNSELCAAILTNPPHPTEIYVGHGWQNVGWNPSILDIPFPAYASRIDAHSGVVSQKLIDMIPGIETASGFSANGLVTGDAHAQIRAFALSKMSEAQIGKFITQAIHDCLKNGVVAVHEMAGPSISSALDARLVKSLSHEFGLHSSLWWGEKLGFARARELGAYGCGGDLFIDGSFGSSTASISQTYEDSDSYGIQYLSTHDISDHISQAIEWEMPIGFHAIGDAAIDSISEALRTLESFKDSIRRLDFRIEHAEFVTSKSLETFVDFGIAFSVQPQFDALWGGENEMYATRLGNRHHALNRFLDYQRAGLNQVFGSDSPVTPLRPWDSIRAAINMKDNGSSLSSRAAFRAHTTNSWRQIGDSRNHEITVGSPADFVLWKVEKFSTVPAPEVVSRWSTDPRGGVVPLPDLSEGSPQALLTITDGIVRFQDSSLT